MADKFPYEDIINLPPHKSKKYPQPTMEDRAARFSPFAAVTGYEEMVMEEARMTDEKVELDESVKEKLSERLGIIMNMSELNPEVKVTYFKPDQRKAGGSYHEITGQIKGIDQYRRQIVMYDGGLIQIDDVIDIESKLFE